MSQREKMEKTAQAVAQQIAQINGASQGDPLTLANSDSPGNTLTNFQFDGSNFIAWSKQVRMALAAKMKLGFVDDTISKPGGESGDLQRWLRCDRMVGCWILNSMTTDLASSFIHANSARELWMEILERYSQSNAPVIYRVKQEMMRLTQGDLTVTAYYTKLKRCWDKIQSLNGVPQCSCGTMERCTCRIITRFLELENQERVMQFLVSLNGEFEAVRSQILAMDPLPQINKVFSLVAQVETQKQITNKIVDGAGFFANSVNQRGSSSNSTKKEHKDYKKPKSGEDKRCSHCNLKGHPSDQCFEVIGYLDWYKGNRNKRGMKMAANVVNDHEGMMTPLEYEEGANVGKMNNIDPDLVQAVCQEMLKAFKGKGVASANFAGFAGPSE